MPVPQIPVESSPNQNREAASRRARPWPSSSLLRISWREYLPCAFPERTSRRICPRVAGAAPQESRAHFPGRRWVPPSPEPRARAPLQTPRPPPASPGSTGTSPADCPALSFPYPHSTPYRRLSNRVEICGRHSFSKTESHLREKGVPSKQFASDVLFAECDFAIESMFKNLQRYLVNSCA